jgi:hypothetical protein
MLVFMFYVYMYMCIYVYNNVISIKIIEFIELNNQFFIKYLKS